MKKINGETLAPVSVGLLSAGEERQLARLENSFLLEIGEAPLNAEKEKALGRAIREERIRFFVARDGERVVGMCSVAVCFSTFTCGTVGIFDDFYVEPAFRGRGVARELAHAAQRWCLEQGIPSLSATCAPCDEAMYQALGFDTPLGRTYAHCGA